MTGQRKAPVDWLRARTLWEADPTLTQAALARMLNVSKVQVTKHVKAQGWKKLKEQQGAEQVVRQRAYSRADERVAEAEQMEAAISAPPPEHPNAPAIPPPPASAMVDTAVEMRAKILERHRRELDGARARVYKALKIQDVKDAFDEAKVAKITSETLKIIQDAERKAWGLDNEAKPVKLVYDKESEW